MEGTPVEKIVAKEGALNTPSRISPPALISSDRGPPANSAIDISNGAEEPSSVTAAEDDTADVSMAEANEGSRGIVVDENGKELEEQVLREEGEEEGEDDEDEEDGDDDDDDDETEDDEDDEGSASESGTFQSVSDMDGVEGDQSKKSLSPTQGEGAIGTDSTAPGPLNNGAANGSNSVAGPSEQASPSKKIEAPKRKRPKRRSPSIDMALPTGPPARPTIRMKLVIAHDDEEAYLTNVPEHIYQVLKEKNHAWADWYAATNPEVQDIDVDGEAGPSINGGPDLSELGGLAKLLLKYPDNASGRKKRRMDEYDIGQYDVRDPFVDDSELGVDEPTHSAKPTSDGFFVTQGEVELQKAVAAAKDMRAALQSYQAPSGKRAPIPVGFGQSVDGGGGAGEVSMHMGLNPDSVTLVNTLLSQRSVELGLISPAPEGDESRQSYFEPKTPLKASPTKVEGTAQSPIRVDDDDDGQPSTAPVITPIAKYPTRPVPIRLEQELDSLRKKVAKESWLKKSKFPPSLREPLLQASTVAVALNEYNDNYFNWLPHIFPYNRLTLHKYVKRQFMDDHAEMMKQLQDDNLKAMGKQIEQALPMLQQEYEEAKAAWIGTGGTSSGHANGAAEQEQPMTDDQVLGLADVDADEGDKADEEATNKGEPVKRWRWSEPMREILFTIVTIDTAILELRTEKINLENSSEKASMTNARKMIYKRIWELWPETDRMWTTTTNISREYALYKKKVERYTAQYQETQGRDINSAILL